MGEKVTKKWAAKVTLIILMKLKQFLTNSQSKNVQQPKLKLVKPS